MVTFINSTFRKNDHSELSINIFMCFWIFIGILLIVSLSQCPHCSKPPRSNLLNKNLKRKKYYPQFDLGKRCYFRKFLDNTRRSLSQRGGIQSLYGRRLRSVARSYWLYEKSGCRMQNYRTRRHRFFSSTSQSYSLFFRNENKISSLKKLKLNKLLWL